MTRVDLRVPYEQRAEAKSLGARWDGKTKTWFVPDRADPTPFARWNPADHGPNVRAPSYFIAQSTRVCWKCECDTIVHGFALTLPFQTRELIASEQGNGPKPEWAEARHSAWLSYVSELPDTVTSRLRSLTSLVYPDKSRLRGAPYWMNHCQHCGSKQGDSGTVHEFDAPLNPVFITSIARVLLYSVKEPFQANANLHFADQVDAVALANKTDFPA